MVLPRRRPLDDEIERLQPVFTLWIRPLPDHGMENQRERLRPRDPLPRFMSANPRAKVRNEKRAEQGVAGYDPQAAAMHTLPHGAHLWSTARGSSPER